MVKPGLPVNQQLLPQPRINRAEGDRPTLVKKKHDSVKSNIQKQYSGIKLKTVKFKGRVDNVSYLKL